MADEDDGARMWAYNVKEGLEEFKWLAQEQRKAVKDESTEQEEWETHPWGKRPLGAEYCGPGRIMRRLVPAACHSDVLFTYATYYIRKGPRHSIDWRDYYGGTNAWRAFDTYMSTELNVIITGPIYPDPVPRGLRCGYLFTSGGPRAWSSVVLGEWKRLCEQEGKPVSALKALVFERMHLPDAFEYAQQIVAFDPSIALLSPPIEAPDPSYYGFYGVNEYVLLTKYLLGRYAYTLTTRNEKTNAIEEYKEIRSFQLVKGASTPERAPASGGTPTPGATATAEGTPAPEATQYYDMFVTLQDWDRPCAWDESTGGMPDDISTPIMELPKSRL